MYVLWSSFFCRGKSYLCSILIPTVLGCLVSRHLRIKGHMTTLTNSLSCQLSLHFWNPKFSTESGLLFGESLDCLFPLNPNYEQMMIFGAMNGSQGYAFLYESADGRSSSLM